MLLGLLIVLWFTSIRVEMLYKREKEDDRGEVKIFALGGLLRFRMELPNFDWKGLDEGLELESEAEGDTAVSPDLGKDKKYAINRRTMKKMKEMYDELVDHIDFFHCTVRWFLSKVTCEKLVWVTKIGTGDAAEAGVLTGIVWGIKTTLVSVLGSYTRWEEPPQMDVAPDFQQAILETHFHSIIRFRVGHAILAIKRLLLHMRKGRERNWPSTPFRA